MVAPKKTQMRVMSSLLVFLQPHPTLSPTQVKTRFNSLKIRLMGNSVLYLIYSRLSTLERNHHNLETVTWKEVLSGELDAIWKETVVITYTGDPSGILKKKTQGNFEVMYDRTSPALSGGNNQ